MRAVVRTGRWREVAKVSFLMSALFFSMAEADVVLTPENLNTALKQLQRLELQLQDATANDKKADVLFQLAEKSHALAQLLTDEVAAHGNMQQGLLDLAIERTEALRIDIQWSEMHQRYFYDDSAYREYLKLMPDGQHAAVSSYRILYLAFFRLNAKDKDALTKAIEQKGDFLKRFPDFKKAPQIELFLGIDFRDVWRICRADGDLRCRNEYRKRVQQQFTHISSSYAGTDEAKMAERLLQRFGAERSESDNDIDQ